MYAVTRLLLAITFRVQQIFLAFLSIFSEHPVCQLQMVINKIYKYNICVFKYLSYVLFFQGRICFGPELNDRKGIIGNVSLGGHSLTDWSVQGLPLDQATLHRMHKLAKNLPTKRLSPGGLPKKGMSLWVGQFGAMSNSVAPGSAILDTFVKLPGWRKVWI